MIKYRRDLYQIIDLSLPGAELGVASGEFSRDILEWGISYLYLVDTWMTLNQRGDGGFDQAWHDSNLAKTKEKIQKYGDRAIILRGLTYEMSECIQDSSLGFVNVDADHSYEGVMRDINAWWPKLKPGGVMAMHDFAEPDYGVARAVTDFFVPKGITINHLPEDKPADAGVYVIKPLKNMLIDFRILFQKYNIKPKGVLHIGGNVGEEAPIYSQLGINRQVWIEANPDIFLELKQNISNNPDASCFCFAAGDEDKENVTLHIANNGGQSSSVLELGTHKIQHPDVHYTHDIDVPMFRVDSFFKDLSPDIDFLNIDVQGFELSVLKGLGDKIKQFKWIYLEVNKAEVYKGCAQLDSIDLFMIANRFRRVETARWIGDWTDALFVR